MKTSEFLADMLLYKWSKGEEIDDIDLESLERFIEKEENENRL